eukprot:TRINITY_DN12677_c0_g1_i1.p1 TRINITY_DN12677_c0_g1~~TRINITY_DN12677_c0_g1_i1.p1  ORF type:complete len:349 (+),score=58.70 TRINITY_DN12677_c0_g1_i1:153-1199(+)
MSNISSVFLVICILSIWSFVWYFSMMDSNCPPQKQCLMNERNWWTMKSYLFSSRFWIIKDVTLLTHASLDRLPLLNHIMTLWRGPVSVCIFIPPENLTKPNFDHIKQFRKKYSSRLAISIFSSDDVYPINILKNRAAQKSQTELVFPMDLEELPHPALYGYLLRNYDKMLDNAQRAVYVVPSFTLNLVGYQNYSFPKTKDEIAQFIQEERVSTQNWGVAHSTQFSTWLNSSKPYKINTPGHYHPYVLVSLKYVPMFDERSHFYEYDSSHWHKQLALLGFEYWVLPTNYLIHIPQKYTTLNPYQKHTLQNNIESWTKAIEELQLNSSHRPPIMPAIFLTCLFTWALWST